MSAGVQIIRVTGATGSTTNNNVTGINSRLNAFDGHTTADTANSVLIPASGTNYSFWASFFLNITSITGGTVNNIKFFSDGTNSQGTGVVTNVATATTYAQATGTVGTTGNQLTTAAYATLAATPVSVFTYTSASPLSITGSSTATGKVGDYVVLQMAVSSTATQGATPSETMTFRYDDTSS